MCIRPTFCEFIFVSYQTVTAKLTRGLEHIETRTSTIKNQKRGNCDLKGAQRRASCSKLMNEKNE